MSYVLTALINLLVQTSYAMTPLTLTATGEITSERAGVVNIGLEGMISVSALVSVAVATYTLNPWLGLLAGVCTGAVIGFIHGLISAYGKGAQIISGVGINIFALGFVPYMIIALWGVAGYKQVPSEGRIPRIGGLVSPLFILCVLIALVTHYVLFRTSLGLKIRALGEEPQAADVLGVHVERLQLIAATYGGALAGVAGAFMSLDWLGTITKEIAAGRGFIALALVVFSNWKPLLAFLGGVLFGFSWALTEWLKVLPGVKVVVPVTIINTLPYVVTLVVVAGVIGRAKPPRKVGIPYLRE
ncbi:MAG: ABC transporter permease [Desulfurococcaceae archaeon TW002]